MAEPLDVDARLTDGRPAVGDLEEYVAACRRLGYQHRDLTMGPGQVRDWYGGEEGMDLRALDADHVALSAAAVAAEDAARSQADLVTRLAAAWSGRGAAEAHEFVWRSGQAATEVSRAVRSAADSMAALRDALWRAVDAKVVATEAVDGRQRAQRAEWLAAAKTVTTGVGDVAAASELVDQRVKPFVDADVGSGWVAAMRTAAGSIDAAYDAAVANTATPAAVFGIPGDLGPRAEPADHPAAERDRWQAPDRSGPVVGGGSPVAAQPAAPVSGWPSPAVTSPSSAPAPVAAPAEAAVPTPPVDSATLPAGSSGALPSLPSLGGLGTGASGLGSGLSGFGQQLADLIGGLVGSADGGMSDGSTDAGLDDPADDPATTDDAGKDDENNDDEAKDDEAKDDEAKDDAAKDGQATDPSAGEPNPTVPPEPVPVPDADTAAVPTPVPEPPPVPIPEAAAVVPPADGQPTPCEIAADQLPQVGE